MKISERIIGKCLILLGFLGVALVAIFSVNASVWSDETNSLINITSPYTSIFKNAVYDCHPPLYHILLKGFVDALEGLGINRIYVSKIFSVVPIVIIYVFVLVKSRKKHKDLVIGCFVLCLCAMPNLMTYAIQIRMYSWALLFVFLTFAYAYEVLTQTRIKPIILFVLFSILASFTHYYACVSVGLLYLFIFIYMFICERKRFLKFFVGALVIVMAFLPWLLSIVDTIKNVLNGFWIKSVSLNSLIGYVWFILFPNIYKYHLSGILGVIMATAFLYVFYSYMKSKDNDIIDKVYVLMGIGCTVGTLLFGIIASLMLGPVYQDRFIYPSLAALWLAFSVCVCNLKKERLRNTIFLLILGVAIINVSDVLGKEKLYKDNLEEFKVAFENMDVDRSVIVTDSYHISCCMSFYFEEEELNIPVYLWNNESDGMWIRGGFYRNLDNLEEVGIVKDYLSSQMDVYFMENIGYNSQFISACEAASMNIIELGTYGLEDREFVLYHIEGD